MTDERPTATGRTANTFAALHRPGDPFVLPNAWDVASAQLLAEAGFPAIGTTSLGVAAARGLADASRTGKAATLDLGRELGTARLRPFLTFDIEDGFADDPAAVADLVLQLGVDGVNLEDSTRGALVDPELHARKIAAVKRAAPTVFVNARTDVFWLGGSDVEDAMARLRQYIDAGADGIFLPGTNDPQIIHEVASSLSAPLNVLASPSLNRGRLGELGVARISTGSLLYRSALTSVLATALRARDGDVAPDALSYSQVQALNE